MKKSIILGLLIILFPLSYGIVGAVNSSEGSGHKMSKKTSKALIENNTIFHADYFLKKARVYENVDDLQRAMFYLKIAGTLSPEDKKITEKISRLKTTIETKSNTSFKNGKKFYTQNRFEEARNQFLTALRYDPDLTPALDYLKNRLIPKEYISYTPGKNDSLRSISKKFYKDPTLDFLIAYFNNLQTDSKPEPGKTLILPILPSEVNSVEIDIHQRIVSAKRLLDENKYPEVIVIADRILKIDPSNKAAIDLKNKAFYRIGMEMIRNKKYLEAVDTFKKISPGYEGVDDAIQNAFQQELLKAENFLKEKNYEASIEIAEKILSYDASITAAKKMISAAYCRQGKGLLIRKNYAEALKVLNKADPADDCSNKMKSAVQLSMKKEAEAHYIRGVKHFLNEELQSAINEWEITLKLDPTHDKAKKNIKNARNLLEKLKKVK
jgi:tetratricopeptide (TPR) repeat protein